MIEDGFVAIDRLQGWLNADVGASGGLNYAARFGRRNGGKTITGPMPEAVGDDIGVGFECSVPAIDGIGMDDEDEASAPGFGAEGIKSCGAGDGPVRRTAKPRLDESLYANAACFSDAIHCMSRCVVMRIEVCWPGSCLGRFVNDVGGIGRRCVLGDALGSIAASDVHCAAAVVEIGMYGGGVEPGERLVPQIEIDEGGEAERQIRSRKLRAIGLEQLRMSADGVVVEWTHAANMYMRIDEAGDEEATAPVDALGV